jgi:hypothetical protein
MRIILTNLWNMFSIKCDLYLAYQAGCHTLLHAIQCKSLRSQAMYRELNYYEQGLYPWPDSVRKSC